jgi:hypothetical protein
VYLIRAVGAHGHVDLAGVLALGKGLYVYEYVYVYMCVCVYVYLYVESESNHVFESNGNGVRE